MSLEKYSLRRSECRRHIITLKGLRRVAVGPDVTFHFENYETILFQIQEMLFIEKGGEAQFEEEREAYSPLIPQGHQLIATMMIEIPNPQQRRQVLHQLGYIEETVSLTLGEQNIIPGKAVDETERTTPEGKTSAVHFLRFDFSPPQEALLISAQTPVFLSINHSYYTHSTRLSIPTLQALAQDFQGTENR